MNVFSRSRRLQLGSSVAGLKEPDAARGLIEFLASERGLCGDPEERDGTARETRKELMGPGRLTRRLS